MNASTVRWTLSHGGRFVQCTERVAPDGVDLEVTYDSLPLAMQHCDRREDAVRWANRLRTRWEASGWSAAVLD